MKPRETAAAKRDRLRLEEQRMRERIEVQVRSEFTRGKKDAIEDELRNEARAKLLEEMDGIAKQATGAVLDALRDAGWRVVGNAGIPDPLDFELRERIRIALYDQLDWDLGL